MRRKTEAFLLNVTSPALIIRLVSDVTVTQTLLKLTQVTPQLEVLQAYTHTHTLNIKHIYKLKKISVIVFF